MQIKTFTLLLIFFLNTIISFAHEVNSTSHIYIHEAPTNTPDERDKELRPTNESDENILYSFDGETLKIEFLLWEGNYDLYIYDNSNIEIASFTSSNRVDYFYIVDISAPFKAEIITDSGKFHSILINKM